jgi:hypothetical protein
VSIVIWSAWKSARAQLAIKICAYVSKVLSILMVSPWGRLKLQKQRNLRLAEPGRVGRIIAQTGFANYDWSRSPEGFNVNFLTVDHWCLV